MSSVHGCKGCAEEILQVPRLGQCQAWHNDFEHMQCQGKHGR